MVGSGVPTAGLVYKLVEVDGRAVAKRSENKASRGGTKLAYRRHRASGTAVEEIVALTSTGFDPGPQDRRLTVPLMQAGDATSLPTLDESRAHHRECVRQLPWEALKLSQGDPGLTVTSL